MNDLIISGTNKLPSVNLDGKNGIIHVAGRSIPEDGKEFYDEILVWVKSYGLSPREITKVIIDLEYLNSSSEILLQNIFKEFEVIHQAGNELDGTWIVDADDQSLMDTAKDFKNLFSFEMDISLNE